MRAGILIMVMMQTMLLGACSSSPYRHVRQDEVIENLYVTFKAPDISWEVIKKHERFQNDKDFYPGLSAQPKGASYHINIQTYPFRFMPIEILFDKDGDVEARNRRSQTLSENDKEQGISYKRAWTDYVKGLRCSGRVFSRNFGGSLYQATTKNYSITCGYYDKAEDKRLLIIDYRYSYAGGNSRLEADVGTKRSDLLAMQQAEDGLKQAVKQLVGTIKIKNFDRERMEREGLLHHGKQYRIFPY